MSLSFEDAQDKRIKNPESFEAPNKEDLDKIKVGDTVKVCIGGERFWNIITDVNGNKIKAVVNNDLVRTEEHGFSIEDAIEFEKRHIYSIYK